MRYVLGLDQGGTKTHAMIADENGVILGMGQSKGACHATQGMDAAMTQIDLAIRQATQQSQIGLESVAAIYAGLTGIDWDYEKELLTAELKKRFGVENTNAVNDSIIALKAGTQNEKGCVLCVGTGFNCAVRKSKAEEFVFGYYVAEEHQGGGALGQKTIQAVLDAEVGLAEPTALTDMLFARFQVSNAGQLLYQVVTGAISSQDKLGLPLLLGQAAMQNDPVALRILFEYGRDISKYAIAGMKRLDLLEEDLDVVLSGSIFKCKVPVLQDAVTAAIHKFAARANIINCRYEPIVGAVLLALEEINGPLSQKVYKNIETASEKFPILR